MLQLLPLLIVLAAGIWTSLAAAELQGWRTPDGKIYYGAEPPPGSTRFQPPTPTPHIRPRPTPSPTPMPAPSPAPPSPTPTASAAATPRPTSAPEPTAMPKPTAIPQPTALPTIAPPPTAASTAGGGGPAAAPARDELADCREFVEIRNTRATIDFYSQLVRVSGDVVVTGGPVRDVAVCIGGSCRPLTGGKTLRIGDTIPFSVSASRHRPTGLTVRCVPPPGR